MNTYEIKMEDEQPAALKELTAGDSMTFEFGVYDKDSDDQVNSMASWELYQDGVEQPVQSGSVVSGLMSLGGTAGYRGRYILRFKITYPDSLDSRTANYLLVFFK